MQGEFRLDLELGFIAIPLLHCSFPRPWHVVLFPLCAVVDFAQLSLTG